MTSERATRANRRNAQASTGPRTSAGKARSGQNARKHGLSAVDLNPAAEAEVERLTVLIAGEHVSDAVILDSARSVAEAQVQLQRVRAFKISLLRSEASVRGWGAEPNNRSPIEIPLELLLQLEGLERYERRALSRRKFAARHFYELVKKDPRLMAEPGEI
ncbi:hypothetical protein MKK69_21735 [Methylobacterium sp. J-026]|uniref:hypothetical protein n=1 Tax=Methylobacterium sp. J-026 TaxID=2836624 RepID=UPI001FB95EA6|nr:hypothetical protein [Methylobacterium sp. J-026]MCJ2136635.1 hypothetical protein [Methylobacterium sp. J-026]